MSRGFDGAIFDVDGVLVDSPHERAWRESLQQLMEGDWREIRNQTSWAADRFTPQVYERLMSGRPRMSGARAALDYFDVPEADRRVDEYAQRKQTMVVDLIEAGQFEAYPDALRFVLAVRAAGIRTAAASSSKNAALFLRKIRLDTFVQEQRLEYDFVKPGLSLLEFFDADVSGRDFAHGKPDPEIFLTAAAELGSPPQRCFVVEDAVSGVQAAKAGEISAIGVARAGDANMLANARADLVVTSLDEVDVGRLAGGLLRRREASDSEASRRDPSAAQTGRA
jgi:beta-phosphoglucomutase-like phosphatase (HAD superfamily)